MLVLLRDEATSPLKWALGRVLQELKGPDGQTRIVEVKTERGISRRAIHNLCPLLVEESKDEEPSSVHSLPPIRKEGNKGKDQEDASVPTVLTTSSTVHRVQGKASIHSQRAKIHPINPAWLQTPFKRSAALQKYYANESETSKNMEHPAPKRPRQEPKKGYSGAKLINLLLIIGIALFPSKVTAAPPDAIEISPWEDTPIIFFEDIAHMHMAIDKWNLMVYYDLEGYWKEFNALKIQIGRSKDICLKAASLNHGDYCRLIQSQLERQLEAIQINNDLLLRRNGNSFRDKRSPLDIVGNVANKLFGILDQEYADQMSDTITKVKENEDHLLELVKNQTSIINSTENIIRREREFTDKQFDTINEYLDKLRTAIDITTLANNQREMLQLFNALSTYSTLILVNFQKLQASLIDVITDSSKGKINPLLLTPQQLHREITTIREHLPTTLRLPGRPHHEDLLQLYNLMTVQARVSMEYVLFNIQLPLLHKDMFQIFQLIPLPIKIDQKLVTVKVASKFLAVSLHRDSYYLLNEDEISKCIICLDDSLICKKSHTIFSKNAGQAKCEVSILNQDNTLPDDCTLEPLTASKPWTQLHEANTWIYNLPQRTMLSTVCGTRSSQTTLEGSGLLRFKSACTIKQDSLTISAHSTYRSSIRQSFAPSIPLNTTFLQNYLNRQEAKVAPHRLMIRNNTEDINQVKEALHNLQKAQHLPGDISHRTHHFTISYLALALILLLIISLVIKFFISGRSNHPVNDVTPQPAPRRLHFQLKRTNLEHSSDLQQAGVC